MTLVAIALGGNLGDSPAIFAAAEKHLAENGLQQIRCASIFRTAPVDCPAGTPDFCNSALCGLWPGTALELLQLCQQTEIFFGRPAQHGFHQSRTLDLDILLFGEEMISLPELQIPHPRMLERYFALAPLVEILPDQPIPPANITVSAAFAKLQKL